MENSLFKRIFRGDKILWGLYFALVLISLFVTFSALTSLAIRTGSAAAPIARHFMTIALGVLFISVIQMAPFVVIKRLGLIGFILGFLGVLFVMFRGGGVGDAARHTSWGQPSELLVLGLIMACAGVFNTLANERILEKKYFYYVAGFIMLCIFLIMVDNLSTAVLAMLAVVSMMLVGGISIKRILSVFAVLAVLFALFMSVTVIAPDKADFDAYARDHAVVRVFRRAYTWKERVARYCDKDDDATVAKDGGKSARKFKASQDNPQVADAKIAICTGGWLPNGPSSSHQRYYLAEAGTDFIFSIAAEEGGFLLGFLLILIYVGVFWRAVVIVRHEQRLYRIMLVTGCAVLIVAQAAVHIAVSLDAMPVTGQPLPMISKGGSSIFVISACFGIIAKVSADQALESQQSLDTATPADQPQDEPEEEKNDELDS